MRIWSRQPEGWSGRGRLGRLMLGVAGAAAVGLSIATAVAQEIDPADVLRGHRLYAVKAACGFCHGWAGDGIGDPRSDGGAPALRNINLDRDQIIETIRCGRPGQAMPYHDRFAYTDDRCYGLTSGDLGDMMPRRAAKTLQMPEITAIADYVIVKIMGRGDPTYDECVEFFDGPAEHCEQYRAEHQDRFPAN